jgi:hypothetical protein
MGGFADWCGRSFCSKITFHLCLLSCEWASKQKLPPTTEERIADNRAQTFADSVMYREALAAAAEARGWSVYWYDRERVFHDAAAALGLEDLDAFLREMGRSFGPPWQAKHKLAAAAALAAIGRRMPRLTAG